MGDSGEKREKEWGIVGEKGRERGGEGGRGGREGGERGLNVPEANTQCYCITHMYTLSTTRVHVHVHVTSGMCTEFSKW